MTIGEFQVIKIDGGWKVERGQRTSLVSRNYIENELLADLLDACSADLTAEPLSWIHEDELPGKYPYDAMFPYSKEDIVRMFPVFGPPAASRVPDRLLLNNLAYIAAYSIQEMDHWKRDRLLSWADAIIERAKRTCATATAPAASQLPDGYRLCLIPLEDTEAFHSACSAAFEEFKAGTGPCGVFIAGHRAMLTAAPSPAAPAAGWVPDEISDLIPRAVELAERLTAPGPKACMVSASETHEISDFILLVANYLAAPSPTSGEGQNK